MWTLLLIFAYKGRNLNTHGDWGGVKNSETCRHPVLMAPNPNPYPNPKPNPNPNPNCSL